jgi:hypothetical protein
MFRFRPLILMLAMKNARSESVPGGGEGGH